MNWYYFQEKDEGAVIRTKSKQMPKAREQSYIVEIFYPELGRYGMAWYSAIYGGRLLKMTYIGKVKIEEEK